MSKRKFSDATALSALQAVLHEPATQPATTEVVASKQRRKSKKGAASQRPSGKQQPCAEGAHHAPKRRKVAEPAHVEGIFEGDTMYLLDPLTAAVYHSERSPGGRLLYAGKWNAVRKRITFQAPEAHEGLIPTPEADSTSAAAAPRQPPAAPARVRPELPTAFPFTPDAEDHCETALGSLQDVKPLMLQLCEHLRVGPAVLRTYDPFYCAGSVKRHLLELGFPCCYNENEDFYARVEAQDLPPHDVLLTNPPYSGDHLPRLLTVCAGHAQPWLLLVPSYVVRKPYFAQAFAAAAHAPFVAVPRKRYVYWSPKRAARDNPKVRKDGRTSPFVSIWVINFHAHNAAVLRWWQKKGFKKSPNLRVYRDLASIPAHVLDASTSAKAERPRAGRRVLASAV